jgi:hypothetical protein
MVHTVGRMPASDEERHMFARLAVIAVMLIGAAACGAEAGTAPQSPPGAAASSGQSATASSLAGSPDADAILREFGFPATDAVHLIDTLDATPVAQRPAGLMASVRPGELQLTDAAGRKAGLPLPTDRFYLSIAPYVQGTHECHFHSLTTCRGELSGAALDVTVRDAASGEVLVSGQRTAFDNGFVGLWLPRDITAEVTIDYLGRQAHATVSTAADDAATCLTTMRLA